MLPLVDPIPAILDERKRQREAVDHPAHYQDGARHRVCSEPIECIDVVETLGFNLGNVVKYIWRADAKGERLEQLRKSAWYLQREIENEQRRTEATS